MLLKNDVAIVTGGAKEIGQKIAFGLAKEGAKVVVVDIDDEEGKKTVDIIKKEYRTEALSFSIDVCNDNQVNDMVKKVINEFGEITILINNAGIMGPVDNIENISEEDWDKTMSVNLKGVFLCSKYVIPYMKKKKNGNIVNIASISGKRALPLRTPYTTTKMGVIGLTRTLAAEVGSSGIRVNSICPGSVLGNRQKYVFEGIMKATGKSWDQVKKEKAEVTALKTFVDPEYIANTVVFLCSKQSWVITGQDINVCGGAIMY